MILERQVHYTNNNDDMNALITMVAVCWSMVVYIYMCWVVCSRREWWERFVWSRRGFLSRDELKCLQSSLTLITTHLYLPSVFSILCIYDIGVLCLHLHVVSMMRGAFPMHTMTDYTEGPVIGPSSLLYECYVIVTLTHYLSLHKNTTWPCIVLSN